MRLLAAAALALVLAGSAAAADREVYFGDAFRVDAADPGPFERLSDGRLACLSDACVDRVVSIGGVTVRVRPRVTAKAVAARQPAYRAPTAVPQASGAGLTGALLFAAAAVLALFAAALVAAELARRRRPAAVDRLRRALRLVRESAGRPPPDRRRALDHLAATLSDEPAAERATRLAWSRPEPGPEPTLSLADEVSR